MTYLFVPFSSWQDSLYNGTGKRRLGFRWLVPLPVHSKLEGLRVIISFERVHYGE